MEDLLRKIYMLADQAAGGRLRTFAWYGSHDASAAQVQLTPAAAQVEKDRIYATTDFKARDDLGQPVIWAAIFIDATAKGSRGYWTVQDRIRNLYNLSVSPQFYSVSEYVSCGGIAIPPGGIIEAFSNISGSGAELHGMILLFSYEGGKDPKPAAIDYGQDYAHTQELGFLLGTRVANTFGPDAGKSPISGFYNSEKDFASDPETLFAISEISPGPGLATTPLLEMSHSDKFSSIIIPGGMADDAPNIFVPSWIFNGSSPPLFRGCGSATTSDAYGTRFSHNAKQNP